MNSGFVFIALQAVVVLVIVAVLVLPERLRLERRARQLLRAFPHAERKSVFLSFPSVMGRRAVMGARIAEVETDGWTLLRATEASPWRTLRSWGGGLTLHFIRAIKVGPVDPPVMATDARMAD